MAYQRLQVSEGLTVITSDTVPIPDPATKVFSGVADFTVDTVLTAPVGTKFTEMGIQKNAIIYNTTNTDCYFVVSVTDEVLTISGDTAPLGGATDSYTIYNAATKACTLYVGTGGNVIAEMASQRDSQDTPTLNFVSVPTGSFMPILVTKVGVASTATNIIALW